MNENAQVVKGSVKWYDGQKGYGFIRGKDGIDFHFEQKYERVYFDHMNNDFSSSTLKALTLTPLSEMAIYFIPCQNKHGEWWAKRWSLLTLEEFRERSKLGISMTLPGVIKKGLVKNFDGKYGKISGQNNEDDITFTINRGKRYLKNPYHFSDLRIDSHFPLPKHGDTIYYEEGLDSRGNICAKNWALMTETQFNLALEKWGTGIPLHEILASETAIPKRADNPGKTLSGEFRVIESFEKEASSPEITTLWEGSDLNELAHIYPPNISSDLLKGFKSHDYKRSICFEMKQAETWVAIADPR